MRRRSAFFAISAAAVILTISCSLVGEIEITSTPRGADVFIDDSLTYSITDCVLIDIPSGKHVVKVVLGDKEYTEEVTVKWGGTSIVNADLAAEKDLLWKHELSGWIRNCPAIGDNGTIYVTAEDGSLTAINPSGRLRWTQDVGTSLPTAPVIDDTGNIYVASNSAIVSCYSQEGDLVWEYSDTSESVYMSAAPFIDNNGAIYAFADNSNLYVFTKDGELDTIYEKEYSDQYTSPAVSGETMFFGTSSGKVIAMTKSGHIKWTRTYQQGFYSSPAITYDGLICLGNSATITSVFVALNADSSTQWNLYLPRGTKSSAAIGPEGSFYISLTSGQTYAIESGGTIKWSYIKSGGDLETSPVIGADGTVYTSAVDSDGKYVITALDPAEGKPLWEYTVPDPVFYLTISPSGVLYATSGKNLYAFYIGQTIADSPWPKFRRDLKNSGRAGS